MLFVEIMEATSAAAFLSMDGKIPYIRGARRKLDALKLLLMVLWESKSLDTKKYAALSERVDAAAKMLGGWQGQVSKQNSSAREER